MDPSRPITEQIEERIRRYTAGEPLPGPVGPTYGELVEEDEEDTRRALAVAPNHFPLSRALNLLNFYRGVQQERERCQRIALEFACVDCRLTLARAIRSGEDTISKTPRPVVSSEPRELPGGEARLGVSTAIPDATSGPDAVQGLENRPAGLSCEDDGA